MEKEMGDEGTRVLIVGANSYVGKHLAEYLNKKSDCEAELVRATNGEWMEKSFRGFDCVVIAAAIVHYRERREQKELYDRVNRKMAIEIATKAKEGQVSQVVFMSTMAVYGDCVEVIRKDTVPNPVSLYGKSKLEAEIGIQALENEKFKVAVVRAPMVYGENCPGNYARLVKLARYTIIFPNIENKRSMVEIEELVKQLDKIICTEGAGIFYPQDQNYGNTSNMVKAIREKRGKKTLLVKWFNFILFPLQRRVRVMGKLFGDCWYEKE